MMDFYDDEHLLHCGLPWRTRFPLKSHKLLLLIHGTVNPPYKNNYTPSIASLPDTDILQTKYKTLDLH